MFELLWQILPVIVLMVLGILAGGYNARRHLRSLEQREQALSAIKVTNLKRVDAMDCVRNTQMVLGQVVIATDYFKTFVTTLRNLVGGEMKAAQNLMTRARREALIRMLEQARAMNATEVCNVRFEFCSISQMRGKRGAMSVEVIAWGTAVSR